MKLLSPSKVLLFISCLFISNGFSVPLEKKKLLENAARIDAVIVKQLDEIGMERPLLASDQVLVRRAFLTTIGRIPTPEEALQFENLNTAEARQDLILYLYEQPGYLSHMTNWAMDLLRLRDKNQKGFKASAFIHWVRDSLAENMPWDEFAQDLVTTTGNAWVDNGAAGYYAMDLGMQNDNLANTAFAFLGVRMECAQCHDDPFQEWERMDFYQLSALVNGETSIRFSPKGNLRQFAADNPEEYQVNGFGRLDNLEQEIRYYVNFGIPENKGKGIVKLPQDWQYDDAKPGEVVAARTPFGQRYKSDAPIIGKIKPDFTHANSLKDKKEKKAAIQKEKADYKKKIQLAKNGPGDGLEVFGNWLVNEETTQFTQTVALRMWERVMGFSLTESLGEYEEVEETAFPELITLLSELMRSYDYDLKAFQATLALTNAFQAKATSKDYVNGDPRALTGRRINRLSAEQIWDSLLSLVVSQPDALPKRQLPTNIIFKGYNVGNIKEIVSEVREMSQVEYAEYAKKTYKDLVAGKFPKAKSGDMYGGGGMMSMEMGEMEMSEMDDRKSKKLLKEAQKDFKNIQKHLRRSSELASPIAKDHFLSTFGQSGRDTIDGSSKEGTVSQALLMYNGAVQRYIVNNKSSTLRLKLAKIQAPDERVKTIFLSTLNREPTTEELTACLSEVETIGDKAYLDILSALISSQEFLFII